MKRQIYTCLAWCVGGAASCIGRGGYPTRAPCAWQGAPAQSQAHEEEDKERWSSQTCKWASEFGLPVVIWLEIRLLARFLEALFFFSIHIKTRQQKSVGRVYVDTTPLGKYKAG